jgi:hypothetical protein
MAFASVLAFGAEARGEPRVIGVEVQAPDEVTVGDHFHYIVTLEGESGTELGIDPGALPLEFQLTDPPVLTTMSLGNGRTQLKLDLEVAAFAPGPLVIPPFAIAYREEDGEEGSVETQAVPVNVVSVIAAGTEPALRDLKPQAEIGRANNMGIYLAALAAVVLALLVIGFLIWRLQRKKPQVLEEEFLDMGPEDRARARLDAAGAAFGRDGDYVVYYAAIAVTIRNYLTERYGFPAFALTTTELQEEMGRRGIDRWQARLVNGLLTQCDAAVYARYIPAAERAEHDLNAAFEIVEMSRPRPAEPSIFETTAARS